MHIQRRLVGGGAAAIIIVSLCPWATAFGLLTVSGVQCRFGLGTLLAGILVVLLEVRPAWLARHAGWALRHARVIIVGLAALVTVLCGLVLVGLGTYGTFASADWGLYLTVLAAVVMGWAALGANR